MNQAKQDRRRKKYRAESAASARSRSHHYFLVCDESGQTGSNLADFSQDFLVYAAWLLDSEKRPRLVKSLSELKAVLPAAIPELKSKYFTSEDSTLRRRLRLADWMDEMRSFGALPVFYVMEQRYAVAGKIVNTLMDDWTNKHARGVVSLSDQPQREAATEFFLQFSEEALKLFALAYTKMDKELLRQAAERLLEESRTKNDIYSAVLHGAVSEIDEIMYHENLHSERQWRALNLPAFLWMLRFSDQIIDAKTDGKGARVTVLHDRQTEFEKLLRENVETLSKIGPLSSRILGCGPVGRLDLRNIKNSNLDFSDSFSPDEIQAADLLAGVVRRTFRALLGGVEWTALDLGDRRLMQPVIQLWNADKSGGSFCSEDLKTRGRRRWACYAEYDTGGGNIRLPKYPVGWRVQ